MHRFLLRLSRVMAYLGGSVLAALIIMTCLSILGREASDLLHGAVSKGIAPGLAQSLLDLGVGPINGDFELIEAGIAFAIFAFLPYCQITGGHATVDIFTANLRGPANRLLRWVTDTIFAAVLILIAVQLAGGMQTKMDTGQTTFLIQFPLWWAYATSLVGAIVAAAVAVYLAVVRLIELQRGAPLLPEHDG